MNKINFENYPSTNTPVSADNLNLLQTNVENGIAQSITDLITFDGLAAVTGTVIIGDLGIEWGTVNVTPANGSGENYYGGQTVNFQNTYANSPGFFANAAIGSTAIKNVSTISVTTTSGNVWMSATNNTTRTCRYLVIGKIEQNQ